MKNIFLILFIILTSTFANSDIKAAYAIGIFNEDGNGENIQHLRETKNDYNGVCFSKIVVFGNVGEKSIKIKIGDSLGHFIKSIPIYNDKKILIANEMTFKHFNLKKGYFEVKIDNKIFDSKVFVK